MMVQLLQSCIRFQKLETKEGTTTCINTGKRSDRQEKKQNLCLCPYDVDGNSIWALKTIPS